MERTMPITPLKQRIPSGIHHEKKLEEMRRIEKEGGPCQRGEGSGLQPVELFSNHLHEDQALIR
jgi:hypothetical protein